MTSLLHFTPSNPIFNFSNIQCRELSKPNNFKPPPPTTSATRIPARDRVIDFGKHRGKMMGTLPSTYLKWVSKNLRARDFEDWAKMADQVLEDPVYKDRLEWEFADKLLNGDVSRRSSDVEKPSAVQELLEISERFGWDNEDKLGWSKIDFQLLGTSNGGRIPRVGVSVEEREGMRLKMKRERKLGQSMGKEEDRERREERRERLKMKRGVVVGKEMEKKDKFGIRRIDKGNEVRIRFERNDEEDRTVGIIHNPFPGREALLKKVLDRKKVL